LKGIIRNPSLLGLLLFRIINALASGNLLAFIPLLAKKAGQSNTEIGILISTNIFITGLLQRPFGRLVSPTNTIRLIMIGSLISAVSLASLPLGRGFFTYLLLGSIMGFGSAISMPAAFVMIMEHGRKLGMSSTMGIFDSAMSLGMILGPLVSGIIMDYVGISYVFYIGGFISLCGMMVFYFLSRRKA
jgi:MFS family permease